MAIYKYGNNSSITYNAVKRLYPWKADITVVHPEMSLPGCEENGCAEDKAHCIKQISAEEVYAVMQAQLCKLYCKKR